MGEVTQFDLGDVAADSLTPLTFLLTNPTSQEVRILEIHSSCGCTMVGSRPEVIGPGETAPLEVNFHAPDQAQVRSSSISMTTEPELTPWAIQLRANVRRLVEVDPREINFGRINVLSPPPDAQRTVTVTNVSDAPVQVGSVFTSAEWLAVEAAPVTLDPGASGEFTVAFAPGSETAGPATVRLEIMQPEFMAIEIPVRLEAIAGFIIEPTRISFGHVPAGRTSTRSVSVSSPGHPEFEVLEAAADHPGVRSSVERVGDGEYLITLTLDGSAAGSGLMRTVLTVRTNDPQHPEAQVDLLGIVTGG